MQGRERVFRNYAEEKIDYAIERYYRETVRLHNVLNDRLGAVQYLAGDCSMADIATWPWIRSHKSAGIELEQFPELEAWFERVGERSAVQRGAGIPERMKPEWQEEQRDRIRGILA